MASEKEANKIRKFFDGKVVQTIDQMKIGEFVIEYNNNRRFMTIRLG